MPAIMLSVNNERAVGCKVADGAGWSGFPDKFAPASFPCRMLSKDKVTGTAAGGWLILLGSVDARCHTREGTLSGY
jgi:hypothetical protein